MFLKLTVNSQVNKLSSMRCGRNLASVNPRIRGSWIFQPDNPIICMWRVKSFKAKIGGISVTTHSKKARVFISYP